MIEIILTSRAGRRDIHVAEREILGLRGVLPSFALAGIRSVGEAIVGFVAAPGEPLPPDGMLFHFPSAEALCGELTVRDVRLRSVIARVETVDGALDDGEIIVVDRPMRPCLRGGDIVLTVRPRADGCYAPDDAYPAFAASAAIVGYPRDS